ncbi:MAG: N-acetylmuramic acid 6-phosphate etherase [Psychrobacillus sp.]
MNDLANLNKLSTEQRNSNSLNIDHMSTQSILTLINEEDKSVAECVQNVLYDIEKATDTVFNSLQSGGRLFYVGAGTSGRLGILDAVECPPTFGTPYNLVQAVMAGGLSAFEKAVEGAEDSPEKGKEDLKERDLSSLDVVIGIAASGRTPYVIGALDYANEVGAQTISLTANKNSSISEHATIKIEVETGPEVITGSTRMKAATAHKLILNMISTTVMIKLGKVYENLMVDVSVSNEKLKERAKGIIQTITKRPYSEAEEFLKLANNEVKPAIVMMKANVNYEEAIHYINQANGFVRKAIELAETKL